LSLYFHNSADFFLGYIRAALLKTNALAKIISPLEHPMTAVRDSAINTVAVLSEHGDFLHSKQSSKLADTYCSRPAILDLVGVPKIMAPLTKSAAGDCESIG
jgi:hypothetical protein